jgi:Homoserine dehydrogenase, NAD binding domain
VEGLRVGMLGCGAVGTGVARLLVEHGRPLRDRAGGEIALQRVAVRDVTRKRDPAVDPTMVSGDAAAVVADPEVDVVVEVMGGIEPARSLILEAIRLGKPVVTANKELLAAHGGEPAAAVTAQEHHPHAALAEPADQLVGSEPSRVARLPGLTLPAHRLPPSLGVLQPCPGRYEDPAAGPSPGGWIPAIPRAGEAAGAPGRLRPCGPRRPCGG